MNKFIILFEGQNADFVEKVKRLGNWARITSQAYAIVCGRTAVEIRDELRIDDKSNRLLVIDITNSSWASTNLPLAVTNWMKSY